MSECARGSDSKRGGYSNGIRASTPWQKSFQDQIDVCRQGCDDLRNSLKPEDSDQRRMDVAKYCLLELQAAHDLKRLKRQEVENPTDGATSDEIFANIARYGSVCRLGKHQVEEKIKTDRDEVKRQNMRRRVLMLTGVLLLVVLLGTGGFLIWKYLLPKTAA